MKSIAIWEMIERSLQEAVPVMLLYVLESQGSSPGRQGFFMAVGVGGNMEGSIGGGIMEHKFVEMAKEKLLAVSVEPLAGNIKKQIHDKSAAKNQSGMICSGEQTILLLQIRQTDLGTIQQIIRSLQENRNGTLSLSPEGIQFESIVPQKNFEYSFRSEDDWSYREKTGYKNELFIIGGGHCALAISRLMRPMDFYIRVYDERKGLKTMVENDVAHEKHFIDDYAALAGLVPGGDNHFVVIMTFGYRTDDSALRALLGKNFAYVGLLGSKTKIETMFEEYRAGGIKEEWLQRIHSPIGLAIKSQTPEEIAVSIAAEIIMEKNKLF